METEQGKAMLMGLYEAARIKAPDAIADPSAEDFVEHSPQVAHGPWEGANPRSDPWGKV